MASKSVGFMTRPALERVEHRYLSGFHKFYRSKPSFALPACNLKSHHTRLKGSSHLQVFAALTEAMYC